MVQFFFVFMIAFLAGVLAVLTQVVFVMEKENVFTRKIKYTISIRGLILGLFVLFVFLAFYVILFQVMGLHF